LRAKSQVYELGEKPSVVQKAKTQNIQERGL